MGSNSPVYLFNLFCSKSACPCLLRELFSDAKNFFWNWSCNSAVKILLPRTIGFVYRLYLFCNICQKYFLTVSSSSNSFLTNPFGFLFYRIYVTAYLLYAHRIVTFRYVDVRKHVRKHLFLIEARQCEVQRGTVTPGFEWICPGLFTIMLHMLS